MATFDEMVVRFLFDTSDLEKGAKQAEATVEKTSQAVADTAGKGEKAQTGAADAIVAGLNRLATAMEKGGERGVQAQKKVAESNKKVGESFEGAIRTGLTFLAVLAGARTVEDFTRKVTALDAALGRTAYGMGQSPQALSALGKAVQRMGGDFGGAVAGMRALSDAYQDFRTTGTSALTEPLTRLQALSGKAVTFGKDTLANFTSIADAIQALDQKGEHALADRLGRQILGSEDLTNLAKRGGTAVRAELAESARHGGLVDPKDVEAAQKLQSAYEGLSQSVVGLGTKVETKLSPYLTKLLDQLDDLIEKHGDEWVEEFGAFLEKHQPDIDSFTTAIGDLAKSVDGITTSFSTGSPASIALEAFAGLLAVRVLGAVTGLTFAMRTLGGITAPSWLSALLLNPVTLGTAAVGAVLASGDPDKIPLIGKHPDAQPQDSDTGLPGVGDRKSGMGDAQAKAGGFLSWFKKAIGWGDKLHEDPKTKDNIEDTAKATKGILDVLKRQADGAEAAAIDGGPGGTMGAVNRFFGRARAAAGGGYTPAGGGGTTPAKGALAANQKGAYAAALKEGLSPTAARALVANMSGEALAVPHDRHWDGTHYSQGIVQWDPTRTAAIKAQFGKEPKDMTVAEQTKTAIWEMKNKYPTTWRALQGNNGADMIGALVDDYERPRDRAKAKAQRMGYYRGFNPSAPAAASPSPPAPAGAGTPSPSGPAVTDAEVFAARQRILNGSRDTKDPALVDRYLKEQNTPKAPASAAPATSAPAKPHATPAHPKSVSKGVRTVDIPETSPSEPWHLSPVQYTKSDGHNALTDLYHAGWAKQPVKVDLTHESAQRIGHATLGHVGREFLHALRQAQRLTHHDSAHGGLHHVIHAALHGPAMENHRALMAQSRDAAIHRHSVVHHVDRRSHTKIGTIAVHTKATDARGIVADLEPVFRRASDAGDFNYGLDG